MYEKCRFYLTHFKTNQKIGPKGLGVQNLVSITTLHIFKDMSKYLYVNTYGYPPNVCLKNIFFFMQTLQCYMYAIKSWKP